MDAIASVSGVGVTAGQRPVFVSAPQGAGQDTAPPVTADLGSTALRLIQAAVASAPAPTHRLDVQA